VAVKEYTCNEGHACIIVNQGISAFRALVSTMVQWCDHFSYKHSEEEEEEEDKKYKFINTTICM
jgi:hypothetical protein